MFVHLVTGHSSTKLINMYQYLFSDATEEEAYEILKLCVKEVHRRLFVSLPNFQVTIVNRDGIKVLPVINSELLKWFAVIK